MQIHVNISFFYFRYLQGCSRRFRCRNAVECPSWQSPTNKEGETNQDRGWGQIVKFCGLLGSGSPKQLQQTIFFLMCIHLASEPPLNTSNWTRDISLHRQFPRTKILGWNNPEWSPKSCSFYWILNDAYTEQLRVFASQLHFCSSKEDKSMPTCAAISSYQPHPQFVVGTPLTVNQT